MGFLAFGPGGAFVLARAQTAAAPAPPAATARATAVAPGRVLIGLDSNPPPTEGYDEKSRRNRARIAASAGVNYVYTHPKWTEAVV